MEWERSRQGGILFSSINKWFWKKIRNIFFLIATIWMFLISNFIFVESVQNFGNWLGWRFSYKHVRKLCGTDLKSNMEKKQIFCHDSWLIMKHTWASSSQPKKKEKKDERFIFKFHNFFFHFTSNSIFFTVYNK